MKATLKSVTDWGRAVITSWDRFWFKPALPHTLALIRICGGAMLLYTHAVWTINLGDFLGPHAWLNAPTATLLNQGPDGQGFAWSYLTEIESPGLLWALHMAALIVLAMLTVGFYTRVTAVFAW